MIERTLRGLPPAPTITAPPRDDFDAVHKLLSDTRERYIAQSAATRGGVVAPAPPFNPQGTSDDQ